MLGRRVRYSDVEAMFDCEHCRVLGSGGFEAKGEKWSRYPQGQTEFAFGVLAGREGFGGCRDESLQGERVAACMSSGRATEGLFLNSNCILSTFQTARTVRQILGFACLLDDF